MVTWIMCALAYKLLLKEQLILAVEPLIWALEERRRKGLMTRVLIAWYHRQERKRR